MSAYDELVGRCAVIDSCNGHLGAHAAARLILAEVLRTLETVTPDQVGDGDDALEWDSDDSSGNWFVRYHEGDAAKVWLAMLRASPLAPPAGAP